MRNYTQLWNGIGRGVGSLVSSRSPRPSIARRAGRGKLVPRADYLEDRTLMSVGLDPTFGYGGEVQFSYPASAGTTYAYVHVTSSALQSDGKIVVGGYFRQYFSSAPTTDDLIAYRLTTAGKLDTSFGSNGSTLISVQAGGKRVDSTGGYVAVQPNGEIVVGGSDTLPTSPTSTDGADFVIARLTAAGALEGIT